MTGGQPVEGGLSVAAITHQIRAEGVGRIAVVTDEPNKYPTNTEFASDVTIHHRNDLNDIQKTLRKQVGVSALIYDQTCAAEKRRRRKRNTLPTPPKRAFINDTVCEGCGDCSWQSNCLSIEPLETEFGRKRAINQSSCNRDFSCVKGFCPSFVTVHGGNLAKPSLQIDVTQNILSQYTLAQVPRVRTAQSSIMLNFFDSGPNLFGDICRPLRWTWN